ncbi:M50 family metallopeptidase, partial [Nocardia sp. NPDC003238]
VTVAHEGGHALVALLTGRRLRPALRPGRLAVSQAPSRAAPRPVCLPENRQPPRKVPSSAR